MNTTTITSSAQNSSTPPANASEMQPDLDLPASGPTRQSEDYYAVTKPGRRGVDYHVCNVVARSATHALKIARNQGVTLPRGSSAVRIGREGYYRALQRCFA